LEKHCAKLAAIHEFTKINNQPLADLPGRLRALAFDAGSNAIAAAWHNAQECMQQQLQSHGDSDDDSDSDDRDRDRGAPSVQGAAHVPF
jgi:hypothetical protein